MRFVTLILMFMFLSGNASAGRRDGCVCSPPPQPPKMTVVQQLVDALRGRDHGIPPFADN